MYTKKVFIQLNLSSYIVLNKIRNLKNIDTDYVILDLGAGTHQFILDMFLLSPQGIVVSAPAVTATLNVIEKMVNSFV